MSSPGTVPGLSVWGENLGKSSAFQREGLGKGIKVPSRLAWALTWPLALPELCVSHVCVCVSGKTGFMSKVTDTNEQLCLPALLSATYLLL